MGAIDVTAKVQELERLRANFMQRGESINIKPAMHKAARYMQGAVIARILRSQRDAGGARFTPLSPAYKQRKARTVGVRQILVRSGRMVRSLSGGSDRILEVWADGFKYGTQVPYADYMARGTNTVPERDFISWNTDNLEHIELILLEHVMDELGL